MDIDLGLLTLWDLGMKNGGFFKHLICFFQFAFAWILMYHVGSYSFSTVVYI